MAADWRGDGLTHAQHPAGRSYSPSSTLLAIDQAASSLNIQPMFHYFFLQTGKTSQKLSLYQQRMELFQIAVQYCVLAILNICQFW